MQISHRFFSHFSRFPNENVDQAFRHSDFYFQFNFATGLVLTPFKTLTGLSDAVRFFFLPSPSLLHLLETLTGLTDVVRLGFSNLFTFGMFNL